MILKNGKTAFSPIKSKSWKTRKIEIFPKRLVDGVGQKLAILKFFFLIEYGAEKCVLWHCRTKKELSNL